MNKAKHSSGFTMVELLVVIAIVSIAAVFTIPQLGPMIKSYHLRTAAMGVVSELQSLKLTALKENEEAKLVLVLENGVYKCRSFIDYDDDNAIDAGEQIKEKALDDSVSVSASTFAGNVLGFNSRGMPSNGNGTITLSSSGSGAALSIVINTVGNIKTE